MACLFYFGLIQCVPVFGLNGTDVPFFFGFTLFSSRPGRACNKQYEYHHAASAPVVVKVHAVYTVRTHPLPRYPIGPRCFWPVLSVNRRVHSRSHFSSARSPNRCMKSNLCSASSFLRRHAVAAAGGIVGLVLGTPAAPFRQFASHGCY